MQARNGSQREPGQVPPGGDAGSWRSLFPKQLELWRNAYGSGERAGAPGGAPGEEGAQGAAAPGGSSSADPASHAPADPGYTPFEASSLAEVRCFAWQGAVQLWDWAFLLQHGLQSGLLRRACTAPRCS